jgi:glucose-6-phosphate 1-epimerase
MNPIPLFLNACFYLQAARMGDFGDEEYHNMVCVEAAATKPPVSLAPGASWTATQTLRAVGI